MSDHIEQESKKLSEENSCDQLKSTEPTLNQDGENDSLEDDTPLVIDTNQVSSSKSELNDTKSKPENNGNESNDETVLKNNGLSKENSLQQADATNLEKKKDTANHSELETNDDESKSTSHMESIIKKLKCTCCANKIDLYLQSMSLHPILKVALCESCSLYYNNWNFVRDVDGKDNQCRWCAKGGDLIVCDTCHNSFCKDCVERNLGSDNLQTILDLDEEVTWSCYVCDDKPLAELQQIGVEAMKANKELEKKLPQKKAANGNISTQSSVSKSQPEHKEKSLGDNYCRKNFTTRDILHNIEKVKPKLFLPVLEGTKSCLQEMLACVDDALDKFNSSKTPGEQSALLNNFKGLYRHYLFNKLGRFSTIHLDEDEEGDGIDDEEESRPRSKLQNKSASGTRGGRPKSRRAHYSEEESDDSGSPSPKRGKAVQKRKAVQSDSDSNASEPSDSDDEYSPKTTKRGRRGSGSLKKRTSVGGRSGRKSKRNASDSEQDEGSDGDWRPQKKAKVRPSLNRSKSSGGSKRGRRKKGVNRSISDEAKEGKESRPKRNVDRRSMAEVDSDADINNEVDNDSLKDDEESKEAVEEAVEAN